MTHLTEQKPISITNNIYFTFLCLSYVNTFETYFQATQ